ncbi:hypothetical protein EDB94_0220 [Marinobacter sp. 3-2]|jgi:preprotein translocase subunit YajC|nr:hypothetical protein EDB94_0220 [Marinobacter sp. 3-2]
MQVSMSRGETVRVGCTRGTVKRIHKRTMVIDIRGCRVRVPREEVRALSKEASSMEGV